MDFPVWLIWFLAGLGVGLAELFVPGFVLIFFAMGCIGGSIAAAIVPDAVAIQVAVFIVVSVVSLATLRKAAMNLFYGRSEKALNPDSDVERGAVVRVVRAIEPGRPGRVKHRGTEWDALSDSAIAAGSDAVITGTCPDNRSCLLVEPFDRENA